MHNLSIFYGQKFFKGSNEELSVGGRLAAGACAGMTSTLVKILILLFHLILVI